jgi:DNA-binding CsgD family transcriptional regulator
VSSSSNELARVKRAAAAKRRAGQRYRETLVAAFAAGYGYAEIAKAAGISRQTVRVQVERVAKQLNLKRSWVRPADRP